MIFIFLKSMSGKQTNNTTTDDKIFTNPAFPGKVFKKVNGKDVIVGYIRKTKTKAKITSN